MPALTLVRHATVLLEVAGTTLLVDPMLDPAGATDPVEQTAPPTRNPTVELPGRAEDWVGRADAVLVTHLHNDHFDAGARAAVPAGTPLLCQPPDLESLQGDGFTAVRAVEEPVEVASGVRVTRVPARHTLGEHAGILGPGSGYVVEGEGRTVYVAGDCVLSPELTGTLDRFDPDVVVLNGGAARFLTGAPITMTVEDVIAAARHAPRAQVVVVHLEALNHCPMTRDELRRHLTAAGLTERVAVPADGERVDLAPPGGSPS